MHLHMGFKSLESIFNPFPTVTCGLYKTSAWWMEPLRTLCGESEYFTIMFTRVGKKRWRGAGVGEKT